MTPEEFAQLQPGDDVIFIGNSNSFVTNGKSYRVVQKCIGTIGSISIVNDQGTVGFISDLNKILKAKKEMQFEVGKQYKNTIKDKIHTCIAFTPEGWPILRADVNHTNVLILTPNSIVKGNWEEYIPPVIHKRYVHWYRTHSKSDMYAHTSLRKLEDIAGLPVLHVQEVSFEERKTE